MEWVEREARQAKELVGVKDAPREGQLLQLMEALGIELVHAPVAVFCCCWSPTGTKIIAPLDWNGDDRDPRLVEEVGHVLFGGGVAPVIRWVRHESRQSEMLAGLCVAREEAIAATFKRAWLGEDAGRDIQPGEHGITGRAWA